MLPIDQGDTTRTFGINRREFLVTSGLGTFGLPLTGSNLFPGFEASQAGSTEKGVILLLLVGGPSQLETWDPKPDAPAEIRGPFRSIATSLAGVRVNEFLPRLARRMNRIALIRSLHHDSAPIHETGLQLLQTGKVGLLGQEHPHAGSVTARLTGSRQGVGVPPFVVLPARLGNTGVRISRGQSAGPLGPSCEPYVLEPSGLSRKSRVSSKMARAVDLSREPERIRDAYGRNTFGESCLRARRLIEAGVRFVTVNMFPTVFDRVTWDCHGQSPFSTLDDYRRELLPTFDASFSALIDDLERTGRLDSTLVVATGEFGRTPRINAAGGRDHWPRVWSAAMAGGGIRGGQVVGASDSQGAEPLDRPVTPAELLATIYRSLGIDPTSPVHVDDGPVTPLPENVSFIEEILV
ncbi:MAG: DUF1501 domain-containing protein [Isosphaeraceae bacterium]